MKNVVIALAIIVAVSGCAPSYTASKSSGWDQQEYNRDAYECKKQVYHTQDNNMLAACLRARGYTITWN
jgi:hypothetical protein